MHQNYPFKVTLAIIFTLIPITGMGPRSPRPFQQKTGIILRNLTTVSRNRRLSCLHIDESFLIFRPAIIERFDNYFRTFLWRCRWSAFLFFSPQQTKMNQDLLDHPMFVDETHDLHQSTTTATKKRVHLPNFFNAFTPDQRRDFLCAEIAYDNYLAVLRCRFLRLTL